MGHSDLVCVGFLHGAGLDAGGLVATQGAALTVYIWRDGWVDKETGEPMEAPDRLAMPAIRSDIEPYKSPLGDHWIDGRTAQREELRRNDMVLAPPHSKPFNQEEYVERKARQAKMLEAR